MRTRSFPLVTLALLVLVAPAPAQTNLPAKAPAAKKSAKTSADSPNLRQGELAALDAGNGTLALKERSGQTTTYGLLDTVRFWKNRRETQADAFQPGEPVALRLRKSRKDATYQVSDVADPATWAWLLERRRVVTAATIAAIEEKRLHVTLGEEALPFVYTISAKTLWQKAGQPAQPSDFQPGDRVQIVPRALPNGGIMAQAIADTPAGAAVLKERKARSVRGLVQTFDTATQTLTLKTAAGDLRALRLAETVEVRQGGKKLPLSALKPGQMVRATVKYNAPEGETATRIALENAVPPKNQAKSGRETR